MFEISSMDKLDVIIALLIILISMNVIKIISNIIINQLTGNDQLKVINYSIDKGNYESALLRCNKQLVKKPKDSGLKWAQATILFKLGRMDEAQQAFEKLAKEEPLWKKDANIYLDSIQKET